MQLKRYFLFLMIISVFMAAPVIAAADDDMIEVGAVEEKTTGDMIDTGAVTAVTKPTAVPTEVPPTPVPTPKPKPKPTPKPVKKYVKPTPVPTAVPTATPTPVMFPEFGIISLVAEEIAIPSIPSNYYGLAPVLTGEKRIRVVITLENNGQGAAANTTAELKANHPRIAVTEPLKELGMIFPGTKTDLSYAIERLSGYDGPDSIKLLLKVKAEGMERELPLEVYAAPFNPNTVYMVLGGIILLIVIFMIVALSGRKKKRSESDFD